MTSDNQLARAREVICDQIVRYERIRRGESVPPTKYIGSKKEQEEQRRFELNALTIPPNFARQLLQAGPAWLDRVPKHLLPLSECMIRKAHGEQAEVIIERLTYNIQVKRLHWSRRPDGTQTPEELEFTDSEGKQHLVWPRPSSVEAMFKLSLASLVFLDQPQEFGLAAREALLRQIIDPLILNFVQPACLIHGQRTAAIRARRNRPKEAEGDDPVNELIDESLFAGCESPKESLRYLRSNTIDVDIEVTRDSIAHLQKGKALTYWSSSSPDGRDMSFRTFRYRFRKRKMSLLATNR